MQYTIIEFTMLQYAILFHIIKIKQDTTYKLEIKTCNKLSKFTTKVKAKSYIK